MVSKIEFWCVGYLCPSREYRILKIGLENVSTAVDFAYLYLSEYHKRNVHYDFFVSLYNPSLISDCLIGNKIWIR